MDRKALDRAFNPRCVAVVGDKMATGYVWLRNMSTFTGKLYSVQIDPSELPGIEKLGIKNYRSLLDIPEAIDYVLVAVPRGVAPRIIADCIEKRVGGVSLFTSGFAETHSEEGSALQETLVQMALAAKLNLIGPNCMGVFNPKLGVRQDVNQYHGRSGPVGFISQSGTHAIFFSQVGARHGLLISKSVSYGNGAVLDSADYLDYLSEDDDTKVIGLYVEGVKDGRRFLNSLRQATRRKPVLVWKGGRGEEGNRAISSHTASLASNPLLWDSLIKQCGAMNIDNLDEMIDCMKVILYVNPPQGKRVALVAQSGGQSVVIADAFTRVGLTAPLLSPSSYQQFAGFFNIIGGTYLNPLDTSWHAPSIKDSVRILDIVSTDANIDSVVAELSLPFLSQIWDFYPPYLDDLVAALADFKARCSKAFVVVISAGQLEEEGLSLRGKLAERGIASFPSFDRAARALAKVAHYRQSHLA
ncbi:MAG: CoA-binding protein [Dehalococcoidia bacterium]|nr:CoA-binding protein [Dehalococcoidia bacterium]